MNMQETRRNLSHLHVNGGACATTRERKTNIRVV
jgi:hypothetical protein